jgi:hypothetical protein
MKMVIINFHKWKLDSGKNLFLKLAVLKLAEKEKK